MCPTSRPRPQEASDGVERPPPLGAGDALKMELTDSNFKKALEGKNAFLFFQAPWCGHCRKLQPESYQQYSSLWQEVTEVRGFVERLGSMCGSG
eukprot:Skav234583  [mRNA]  locus=scaffold313:135129:141279:- [translate_table: standard]